MCVFVSVCAICFTIVLLSQIAGKNVVLFILIYILIYVSAPPCILLTHCSFTLPPLYIVRGMYSVSTLVLSCDHYSVN